MAKKSSHASSSHSTSAAKEAEARQQALCHAKDVIVAIFNGGAQYVTVKDPSNVNDCIRNAAKLLSEEFGRYICEETTTEPRSEPPTGEKTTGIVGVVDVIDDVKDNKWDGADDNEEVDLGTP